MKILGIDQSYTSCGFVVIEDGKLIYGEKFMSTKALDKFQRAWQVAKRAVELADEHEVDAVGIEGLAFGGRGNATRDLAGLQWAVVINLQVLNGYTTQIVGIGTAKKLACGKGNAGKEILVACLPQDVRKYFDDLGVKKTTGLSDLSDAYWIGMVLYDRTTK